MNILKGIALTIVILIGLALIGWASTGFNLALFSYFAPKFEQVKRNTFEQSKAYNQGMTQELDQNMQDYNSGNAIQKAGIRSMVLHRVADYPISSLPGYLQQFVEQLRNSPPPDLNPSHSSDGSTTPAPIKNSVY